MSRIRTALAAAGVLVLAACGGQSSGEPQEAAASQSGPERVAALSSDAAEAVRALVGVDRLVAVPASTTNEHLGNHVDEMEQVPNQVPSNSDLDPEQVLSWSPDLVVVTSRHDGEQDAGELLEQTDVPLVAIDNNWGTVDQLRDNYREIAEALGEQDRAEELIANLDDELAEVSDQLEEVAESPTVLVLTNQATNPFIAGPDSMTTDVVRHAGGTPVVEEAGISGTMPADPEQVVRLDPDAILLVDVLGKGEESFEEVLGNEAVAELPAVREERILLLPGRSAMAAAGMHVAEGVRAVGAWLHPEHVQATSVSAGEQPERIAALSGDVAEVMVELVGPERLVAVPESTTTPGAGNSPDLMARVPNTIGSVSDVDPEQILSYGPDLVVVTSRHEAEQDAGQLLTDSGVPVVVIDNNWETFDQIADNITTLGAAAGEPERASELVTAMREQVAETTAAVSDAEDQPSVLVLLSLGSNNPYIVGPQSISTHLVSAAGAALAVTELGSDSTVQADPELLVKSDPDAIVLINSQGRGIDDYEELLANPAVAELDAIRDDNVLLLDSTVATATAGVHTAEGLDQVARWLHPERFDAASGDAS